MDLWDQDMDAQAQEMDALAQETDTMAQEMGLQDLVMIHQAPDIVGPQEARLMGQTGGQAGTGLQGPRTVQPAQRTVLMEVGVWPILALPTQKVGTPLPEEGQTQPVVGTVGQQSPTHRGVMATVLEGTGAKGMRAGRPRTLKRIFRRGGG